MRAQHDQPWVRVEIAGKRCRVQVLDPETAFDLEPRLVAVLGDQLALAVAAPLVVAQRVVDVATEFEEVGGRALSEIINTARMLEACLADLTISTSFALEVAEAVMFDRLDVKGRTIEDWGDFVDVFGRSPLVRWSAVARALGVTFGPLWTRKPYHLRITADAGPAVRQPPGVSRTRLWCEQLAAQGHAPSSVDILRQWTPVDVLESVESLAFVAERERRATAAARAQ